MNFDTFSEIDYFTNIQDNNTNEFNNMMNNSNVNSSLFSPYEGYIKGNLFKKLYNGYKNYKPVNIPIKNERDEMLLNIGQLSFTRHELNLLLDNYPNNKEAIKLFNKYKNMEDEQVKTYEMTFGPLCITSSENTTTPFNWENDKWPWEV